MIKRSFDIFFSTLALVVLSPLLLVVSALSAVFIGFPVFFVQDRVGKNHKLFKMIKFRTMSNDESLPEEKRISKWGRFLRGTSIDELPELINIIKGDMSIIGPRPLLKEYIPFYDKDEDIRHLVKPGLSGIAQIKGRNTISWKDKFAFDREYVEKQSIILDIKIIFLTLLKVFKREGIDSRSGLSMERFDNPLYILGASGHGKSVLATIEKVGVEVRGFLDDGQKENTPVMDQVVRGSISSAKSGRAIIGIGNNAIRKKISNKYAYFKWVSFIHPTAVVHPTAKIGKGSIIMAGSHIGPDVFIGDHVIINNGANVEHDSIIENFVHIAPGSTLCGGVKVGESSFIGAGSTVIPQMTIGENVTVGAGSTVIKNLESNHTYVGSPAKELEMGNVVKLNARSKCISMARPVIDQSDIDGVVEVLKSGHLSLGPKTVEFENIVKDYVGVKHALAVSSGTSALHLILLAMGIGEGDEVLVPSFTFISSVSVIMHVGAKPVFVDIDESTYCMSAKDLKEKVTKKSKAILAVDIFGHPADWDSINKVAKEFNLYTIDDSCEALGAKVGDRMVGSLADASTFAFYPNKQITTGEGGMIVTDNDEIASTAAALRNQGRSSMGGWLQHDYLGFNFRIDEMSASLGVTQMKKIDEILKGREEVALKYNEAFKGTSIQTQNISDGVTMSWFVYVITLEKGVNRDEVIEKLAEHKIPARAYFDPIHNQPFMKGEADDLELPVTMDIASRTIALPFHAFLTGEEITQVSTTLVEIVENYKQEKSKEIVKSKSVA